MLSVRDDQNENELTENEIPFELTTELVCSKITEECEEHFIDPKMDEEKMEEETDGFSASTNSSSTSCVSTKMVPMLEFEDELFGLQDSDLSFVTTLDPLNEFAKELVYGSNLDNNNNVEQVDTNKNNKANEFSPLRNIPLWIFDDKSPEFAGQKAVASYYRRILKWK